jgi:uncharacterized protein YjbI with pentapeptide repeats
VTGRKLPHGSYARERYLLAPAPRSREYECALDSSPIHRRLLIWRREQRNEGRQVDQGQIRRERALYLLRRLAFAGQLTETQVLWIIRISIVFGLVVLIGYTAEITFGEWYTLFIIPALLAAAGYWFNYAQSNRQQKTEEQRAQNSALQDYLNTMKDLLLNAEVPQQGQQEDREMLRKLAQAQTLTVLSRLDGSRQGSVVRFLSEAGLIDRENPIIRLGGTRRGKLGVDQLGERRGYSPVSPAGLGEFALTLAGVKLHGVDLQGVDFSSTDLSHVQFYNANLSGADLRGANLRGSILVGADLVGANLTGSTLDDTAFPWANLYQVVITDEEIRRLAERGSLTGAVTPDGSRPFPIPPEVESEFRKHPDSELAQRERELGRIARLLKQQASSR